MSSFGTLVEPGAAGLSPQRSGLPAGRSRGRGALSHAGGSADPIGPAPREVVALAAEEWVRVDGHRHVQVAARAGGAARVPAAGDPQVVAVPAGTGTATASISTGPRRCGRARWGGTERVGSGRARRTAGQRHVLPHPARVVRAAAARAAAADGPAGGNPGHGHLARGAGSTASRSGSPRTTTMDRTAPLVKRTSTPSCPRRERPSTTGRRR